MEHTSPPHHHDMDAPTELIRAEDEWFTALRTRTPFFGRRQRGAWAMQPFGRGARWVLLALAVVAGAAIAAARTGAVSGLLAWLTVTVLLGYSTWLAFTFPWRKGRWERARWLERGTFIRMPGQVWRMDCVDRSYRTPLDTVEIRFTSGRQLTFDEEREVMVVSPAHGKFALAWMYGRKHRDIYAPELKHRKKVMRGLKSDVRAAQKQG